MILLDTNVISAMNEAEILHGLARLPDGRRMQELQQLWGTLMAELFTGRVLPFTSEAAHWYAELLRRRERMGRAMATADAVIAATALAQGAALATRDVDDFADSWSGADQPLAAALILPGRRVQPQGSRPALRQRSQRGMRGYWKPPRRCC